MLKILGPKNRYCDGLSRRGFLQIGSLACGALGMGGLSLPNLLATEQPASKPNFKKSIIMIYLTGGMAHQDSFDLKPNAPAEIRGEFKPIDTNLPGVQICEHLPRLAKMMDRLSVIRSVVGMRDEHSSFHTITGYPMGLTQAQGRPHFGSVISRIHGPSDPAVPPFVDLFPTMQHRPYNSPGPGFLGPQHAGVRADSEDLANMKLRFVSQEQFASRKQILSQIDEFRRQLDRQDVAKMDSAYQKAYDVLNTSKLVDALDLEKETPAVRDRYGRGNAKHQGDGASLMNDHFLMARRLVEIGVRCVSVAYGFWDTHGNNFGHLKGNLPVYDQGVSALIEDLQQRGMDKDVTVVVWGEFGRTPKINKDAGRDHWAAVNSCLLAGGGMKMGQVIGSTDKQGAYAADRPVHYQDILATLYQRMGIDGNMFVRNFADRPVELLPPGTRTIPELVS